MVWGTARQRCRKEKRELLQLTSKVNDTKGFMAMGNHCLGGSLILARIHLLVPLFEMEMPFAQLDCTVSI